MATPHDPCLTREPLLGKTDVLSETVGHPPDAEEALTQVLQTSVCEEDAASHRRRFISLLRPVPAPIAIVACASDRGTSGLAATAWCSLSADPPMLLACVNRSASAHDLILAAGAFSINVLPETQDEACAIFSGQRGLEGIERFLPGHWSYGKLNQPMLAGAVAAFECRLAGSHSYGSHTIITGSVEAMAETVGGKALLYVEGQYARAQHRG